MTYIIVDKDNKIKLLNIPAGVDKTSALERTMKKYPDGTRVFDYDKVLPPTPSVTWVWNDETQAIEVDESLTPVDWAGLVSDFEALDADMKMKLSHDYPSIAQALREGDEEYLLRLIVSRETSLSDKDKDRIRSILDQHGVDLNKWVSEIPF